MFRCIQIERGYKAEVVTAITSENCNIPEVRTFQVSLKHSAQRYSGNPETFSLGNCEENGQAALKSAQEAHVSIYEYKIYSRLNNKLKIRAM
jgi:hypothetical protein